ncbi:hypothetical protein [Methylobacterium frigidaeris]|uniref:hypothetical protein n=1 Tax=Methylobacterium frigidaeris TaxID=2038277 RepID=UPI001EDFD84D|nr:hypothetical protein [Methylobacterium frigidaeris]
MPDPLHGDIIPFERQHAIAAGGLRGATRAAGLSSGDRACLAPAAERQLTVLIIRPIMKNFRSGDPDRRPSLTWPPKPLLSSRLLFTRRRR